ncbi:hypothetical protein NUSPORA_00665 [Nucleospora cyclopteri]
MLILSEITDFFELKCRDEDKKTSLIYKIRDKYIDRTHEKLGIGVAFQEIVKIGEFEAVNSLLKTKVTFKMIFKRFLQDEIVNGTVKSQNENCILAEDEEGITYEITAKDMLEGTVFENNCWVWKYKNNDLKILNGNQIRFRIKELRLERFLVEATMDEQGLGLIKWWD